MPRNFVDFVKISTKSRTNYMMRVQDYFTMENKQIVIKMGGGEFKCSTLATGRPPFKIHTSLHLSCSCSHNKFMSLFH